MYNKVRLTKRQIKEDKFTTFMLTSKQQVMENWQFYVIGALVLVLIVVGAIYYIDSQKTRAEQARYRYDQAVQQYRSGQTQVAILTLVQVVEEYGDSDITPRATYMLGRINYDLRNYPEALRHYELYLDRNDGDLLTRAAAYGGVGSCHANEGNYQAAANGFMGAYSEYADGPLAAGYLRSAVRNLLELGDVDAASAQLEILSRDFKGHEATKDAVRIFAEMTGRM